MLQLELPHINVLSKIDLIGNYGDLGLWLRFSLYHSILLYLSSYHLYTDFNLDFYTEVQDLSYLENSLSTSLSPRFQALNLAMISLIEDYNLVGFETLAVEVSKALFPSFVHYWFPIFPLPSLFNWPLIISTCFKLTVVFSATNSLYLKFLLFYTLVFFLFPLLSITLPG